MKARAQKPFSVTTRSRGDIAAAVMKRVVTGPSFSAFGMNEAAQVDAATAYRLWAETWLLEDLRYLLHKDLP